MVVIFRDVTARRRSERNLELLSDSGRALAQPLDFQATLQNIAVNANITVETGPWANKAVVCFEGEIRQVLNNLVGNALDAMPHGGKLSISSRAAIDRITQRKGLILRIADTGGGIPDEVMKKIFEPFFTTKGINGTGLGLWVSKEIVERHKGWLRARSSHDPDTHGTVFSLFSHLMWRRPGRNRPAPGQISCSGFKENCKC